MRKRVSVHWPRYGDILVVHGIKKVLFLACIFLEKSIDVGEFFWFVLGVYVHNLLSQTIIRLFSYRRPLHSLGVVTKCWSGSGIAADAWDD